MPTFTVPDIDVAWLLPALAAATVLMLAVSVWSLARGRRTASPRTRPPAAVVVTGIAAACCTAYSADTSWRFAEHSLGMVDELERAFLFGAGELALFATALLARQNLRASGAPGVPGVLVWVITGVQIIPAYAESGVVGGSVRSFFGPILAALLWHLAMGIELRHARPGALSSGLAATIGRELRERLLSHLGLATRDRTAEQITRDRATATAVRLASRRRLYAWGQRRLAAAVTRAQVGTDPVQRQRLLAELGARRGAIELRTITLASPWAAPEPPARPATLRALTHEQLRRMDPLEAVRTVRSAHPGLHPSALASLCIEYGIVVTETQVRIAIGAGNAPAPASAPAPPAVPEVHPGDVPETYPKSAPEAHPHPAPEVQAEPAGAHSLVLDLAPMPAPAKQTKPQVTARVHRTPRIQRSAPAPVPVPAEVLAEARRLYPNRIPSVREIKRTMHVGQPRAQDIRAALMNTPAPAALTGAPAPDTAPGDTR